MKTKARAGNEYADGTTVAALDLKPLVVPVRDEVRTVDLIACGFHQEMLSMKDEDGNGGEVCAGAGLGSDFITLKWKDGKDERSAILRGSEILRAWVATFDPEAAARFPELVKEAPDGND